MSHEAILEALKSKVGDPKKSNKPIVNIKKYL